MNRLLVNLSRQDYELGPWATSALTHDFCKFYEVRRIRFNRVHALRRVEAHGAFCQMTMDFCAAKRGFCLTLRRNFVYMPTGYSNFAPFRIPHGCYVDPSGNSLPPIDGTELA
ncbi:hypothetical protein [Qipengyuania huizhouensis]|uniref:hypothetical protein n=1 Tax=Qipengyuania huizhouensis TaxID=2867245 RepID=UPI0031ED14C8